MRFLPSFARLTLAAATVVAASFASSPATEGSLLLPVGRHAPRLACRASALPRAERLRLKRLANPERTVLRDIVAALDRGDSARVDDDVAAIQSDAPAAPLDARGRVAPLQPIGRLVGSRASLPRLGSFSRRSPRGPPFY